MPRRPFQFLLFRSEGERLGFRDLSNNVGQVGLEKFCCVIRRQSCAEAPNKHGRGAPLLLQVFAKDMMQQCTVDARVQCESSLVSIKRRVAYQNRKRF